VKVAAPGVQPQAKVARVPRARGDECMAQGDGQRVCGPRVKRTGVQPQANAARVWQAMGDGYPVSGEGGGHAALGEGSGRADLGEGGGHAAPGEGDGLAAPAPGKGGEGDKGYERQVHGPRPRRRACGPRVKRTGMQPHATPRECGSSHSGIDKVRRTLGGDWSRLGSPQMVRPNMLSYFGLLSVTARFGIPRALRLTHLVAFQPPELCGCGFTQWHSATASVCTFTLAFVFPVAESLFDTG
jgi:hypothetical protein